MKTLLLVTAAAAAFAAAPAMAQSTGPVGSAGITWSNVEADVGGSSVEDSVGLIDGSVAGDFGAWTVTFDGSVGWTDGDLDEDRAESLQVHVTRKFDDLRIGGFVGLASEDVTTFGLEAQKYSGALAVGGALAVSSMDEADIIALNGELAYFVQDDLRLNIGGGVGNIDTDFGNTRFHSMGAGAEYRVPSTPLSVYGAYDRASLDDLDLDVDTVSIGLRVNFGADSLRARNESGADLGRIVGGLGALAGF